ncbi:N-acetylmannosamine-6-phosphate 2-epimerase, partial [Brevibacillus halotolerans]|nr:N-acetylmannosamine-6-phosphate 2-epimerase [Brevibacillus halotolerans]
MNEITNEVIKEQIKHGLVVSCQALPDEPLHSAFIMGRMARAAEDGGA